MHRSLLALCRFGLDFPLSNPLSFIGEIMSKTNSHIGKYLAVFGALLVLTAVTVGVSYLHLGIAMAIIVAMIVAVTKGSLVAAYFMHLIGENRAIFIILAITAIFFVMVMAVPTLVFLDDYRIATP